MLRTVEAFPLISLADQSIRIEAANQTFQFKQFEAMHLEYSHKFTASGINKLASKNGFNMLQLFTDDQHYFADALWQVK